MKNKDGKEDQKEAQKWPKEVDKGVRFCVEKHVWTPEIHVFDRGNRVKPLTCFRTLLFLFFTLNSDPKVSKTISISRRTFMSLVTICLRLLKVNV